MSPRLGRGISPEFESPRNRHSEKTDSGSNQLSELQEEAGNQAVSHLLSSGPQQVAHDRVAHDRGAEREADQVADAAVARMGPGASSPAVAGGALAPGLRQALTTVSPGLSSLDDVKVHTGSGAESAAEGLGARAFTSGRDVSVGRGELSSGVESNRLMAHEAVHASNHAPATPGLVHAKLKGTKQALVDQAGGPTTTGFRKYLNIKTNWDKIVSGVGAYEELETALLKGGQNPTQKSLMSAKPKMLRTLARIEASCLAWQETNGQDAALQKSEEVHDQAKNGQLADTDTRDKAQRRQAIGMLLPRIRTEMSAIGSPNGSAWLSSLGLNPAKVTQAGREDGGQKNQVSELMYQTEQGEFSGFFKAEKGFAKDAEFHEIDVGIHQTDPNYGARAMAMYKIDQLLNAGVTTRVEWAVNQTKDGKTIMGTVLQSAKGTKAADLTYATTNQEAKQSGGVSLDDAVLQRSLNKLQLLDAICGQLDRHAGNYYVQTDGQGAVTGVTGIDLDMAFGQDMKSHNDRSANAAINYRGLPSMIDADMGRRILQITPKEIEAVLGGLLSASEVTATVSRLQSLQEKIGEMEKSGQLTEKWGEESGSKQQMKANDVNFGVKRSAYQHDLQNKAKGSLGDRVHNHYRSVFVSGQGESPLDYSGLEVLSDLPELTRTCMADAMGISTFGTTLVNALMDQRLTAMDYEAAMLACNAVLEDSNLIDKMSVAVMESSEGSRVGSKLAFDLNAKATTAIPKILVKLAELAKPKVKAN